MDNTLTRAISYPLAAIAFLATFCCMTTPAVAAADDLGQHAGTVNVPAGLSQSDVQDAIVAALSGRQWGVKEKGDGRVVGYLKHRSNEATVTLTYDATKIDLYCVGWQITKKTGVREKPEQPKGWLKNIQGDLTKHLSKSITAK